MMTTDDTLRAEIAAHYPDADVEWLLADYRDHCRGCEVGDEPTFHAWLDDQPIAYWDAHGVRHGYGTIPQSALDDFAEYQRCGGRFDLAVWWDRYREDYADGR